MGLFPYLFPYNGSRRVICPKCEKCLCHSDFIHLAGTAIVIFALVLAPQLSYAKSKSPKCRDATTGQYVSHKFAKKYPASVVCEKAK
jgi:hypothetical protein